MAEPEYGISTLSVSLVIFRRYPRTPSALVLARVFLSTGVALRA